MAGSMAIQLVAYEGLEPPARTMPSLRQKRFGQHELNSDYHDTLRQDL